MSDFSEGDTLKLVLFSDSHGNVANMADVVDPQLGLDGLRIIYERARR